jgi:hypothetical protein
MVGELVLVRMWGAAFGAIGIYNQAAILRRVESTRTRPSA